MGRDGGTGSCAPPQRCPQGGRSALGLSTGALGSSAAARAGDMAAPNKPLWGRSSRRTSGDAGGFLAGGW